MSGYYAPSYMPSARPATGMSESKFMASLPAQLMASVGSSASSSIGPRALPGMTSAVALRPVAPIVIPNVAPGSMNAGVVFNLAPLRTVAASPAPTMAPGGPMAPRPMAPRMFPGPIAAGGMVGVPGTMPYVLQYVVPVVPVPADTSIKINPAVASAGLPPVPTGSPQPSAVQPPGPEGRTFASLDHELMSIFTSVALPTATAAAHAAPTQGKLASGVGERARPRAEM